MSVRCADCGHWIRNQPTCRGADGLLAHVECPRDYALALDRGTCEVCWCEVPVSGVCC